MNYKHNSISACFRLNKPLTEFQLSNILRKIKILGCDPVGGATSYNEDFWIEQELKWTLFDRKWAARFRQIYLRNIDCTSFAFDLESEVFLPGANILYIPEGDQKFIQYKNLLSHLLTELKPRVGEIDYEVDTICPDFETGFQNTIVGWGNFFPLQWINHLEDEDKNNLMRLVDETIDINGVGMLTFLHPLKANQNWSLRHEQLDRIIKKYFF